MKKLLFKRAEFITSAFQPQGFPQLKNLSGNPLPEIAFVGRSNVGKSSLINHLLQTKSLAKISSTPGKTQSINFFDVDQALCLVDLPGYGYAKAAKNLQKNWSELIDIYLEKRSNLQLILLLIDSRHPLSKDDRAFIEWALFHKKPLALVLTKMDKLNSTEQKKLKAHKNPLELSTEIPLLYYSNKAKGSRLDLIQLLNRYIHGTH